MNLTESQIEKLSENPKAFLNRARGTRARITAKRERIAEWRLTAESITAPIRENGGFGGGSPESKVEKCICNIDILERQIVEEIDRLTEIEREISEAVKLIEYYPNAALRDKIQAVLEMRFQNCLEWNEIAARLKFTERWVLELYKKSLIFFKNIKELILIQ